MPPPFTFLRNLTNHQPKAPNPTAPGTQNTPHNDDKPTKLVKRKSKSRRTAKDYIPPQAHQLVDSFNEIHQLVDSFNEVIGPAIQLDDISPSRYPPHPFAVASMAGSNHSSIANAGPSSYRPDTSRGVNPGFQGSGISIPRSSPAMMSESNRPQYASQRGHHEPSGDLPPFPTEHRPDISNSFATPDETPVVSQYMANGYRQSQVPLQVPPPPSRTWSPIPSVHREPSRTEESYSPDREGVGDQSWLENGNLGNRFSADVTDPRISTMADPGRPDSRSIHTLQYVDYPDNPKATSIARTMTEHWEIPPNIQSNLAAPRRQPSHMQFQTPQLVTPEITEPAMFQQEYWDEEDSDPEVYHYIVPAGLKVTFQDREGNMITRVGKTGQIEGASRSSKSAPIVVHDEFGKELYRSKSVRGPSPTPRELQQGYFRVNTRGQYNQHDSNFRDDGAFESHAGGGGHHSSRWISQPSTISSKSTKTIMIDEKGNQMPLKSPSIHQEGGRRLEQSFRDISYQARISNI